MLVGVDHKLDDAVGIESVGYVDSTYPTFYQGRYVPGIGFSPQSSVLGCVVVVTLTLIGEIFLNTRSEADNRKSEALNSIGKSMERSADLRSVMYRHLM